MAGERRRVCGTHFKTLVDACVNCCMMSIAACLVVKDVHALAVNLLTLLMDVLVRIWFYSICLRSYNVRMLLCP